MNLKKGNQWADLGKATLQKYTAMVSELFAFEIL